MTWEPLSSITAPSYDDKKMKVTMMGSVCGAGSSSEWHEQDGVGSRKSNNDAAEIVVGVGGWCGLGDAQCR